MLRKHHKNTLTEYTHTHTLLKLLSGSDVARVSFQGHLPKPRKTEKKKNFT